VHDLEEVLAFERWARTAVPRLCERFPRVPGPVWQRLESTSAQDFALAVAIVGVLLATASAAGQASGGRSRYFQLMLAGFGLHTVGHVASAVGARGYTPGVVTAPILAERNAGCRDRAAGDHEPEPPAGPGLGTIA
jgi:hypothetical protein